MQNYKEKSKCSLFFFLIKVLLFKFKSCSKFQVFNELKFPVVQNL